MEYLFIVVSSLLSGILGVVISAWYYSKKEKKTIQVKLIVDLFANRHQLTSTEFNRALNSIPVIFCESDEIVTKYNQLHALLILEKNGEKINKALFDFMNALIKHTGLSNNGFSEETIRNVFGK